MRRAEFCGWVVAPTCRVLLRVLATLSLGTVLETYITFLLLNIAASRAGQTRQWDALKVDQVRDASGNEKVS